VGGGLTGTVLATGRSINRSDEHHFWEESIMTIREIITRTILATSLALPLLACHTGDGQDGAPPEVTESIGEDVLGAADRDMPGEIEGRAMVSYDLQTGAETALHLPATLGHGDRQSSFDIGYLADLQEPLDALGNDPQGPDSPPPPTIIGGEDRVRITSTTDWPHRAVVQLVGTFTGGVELTCSGTLVGTRTVVTAAHCVFDHVHGLGWADTVEVVPGKDGAREPYGSTLASHIMAEAEFVNHNDAYYDWAIMTLNSHIGELTGWMGYAALTDGTIDGLPVELAGYPGDLGAGLEMYHAEGWITDETDLIVGHDVDINDGMSGAGIRGDDAAWADHVVAVNTAHGVDVNYGTRIDDYRFDTIEQYLDIEGTLANSTRWPLTNTYEPQIAGWAAKEGVQVIAGHFNNDDYTDVVLTGRSGWNTVPVAFSDGAGGFSYTNSYVQWVPSWTANPNATVHAADFDGDGLTDLALTNSSDWNSVPVAFSNGDGTFDVTNMYEPVITSWAKTWGVDVVAGQFNDDDCADLAFTGAGWWGEIRLALSNCDGTFDTFTHSVQHVDYWASIAGVQLLVGNFDGDDYDDILLTGGNGWGSLPVAFANGDGTFTVTNHGVANVPGWATQDGVQILVGNFDGAGGDDLALTGVSDWATMPTAISNGNGTFTVHNDGAGLFALLAQMENVTALAGTFDGDSMADVALLGSATWNSVPIAMGN